MKMKADSCQEKPMLVNLLPEPDLGEVIQDVISIIKENGGADVMLDFSNVGIIRAENLGRMLTLRKLLEAGENRLVLTKVSPKTLEIFKITHLDRLFSIINDGFVCWDY